MNLLKLLDNRNLPRSKRFIRFGLINTPGASAPEAPDQYGFMFDQVADFNDSETSISFMGRDSGIMGMRLFDNPNFDPQKWNAEEPWTNFENPDVQPPYMVGLTCGFCHVSFSPTLPPEDPAEPKWENLAANMGNIYLKEGPLFSFVMGIERDDFRYWVLNNQQEGTSYTSRIATDDIDNPNAINAIFNLPARLTQTNTETMPNGQQIDVPHILKDGADSVGIPGASVRVYVNIGMLGDYWLERHDGSMIFNDEITRQQPFEIHEAMRRTTPDGNYSWNQTEVRMADAKAYLSWVKPLKLAEIDTQKKYLQDYDSDIVNQGKQVFADNCARCHSSEQPDLELPPDLDPLSNEYRDALREIVSAPDFLTKEPLNFLSTDKRYAANVIDANIARSMGTNAAEGYIWDNFSSQSYKDQKSIGTLELPHPWEEGETIKFKAPSGGRGYYRVASLVNIWSTAPWLHNNSMGEHFQDPSLEGRMRAFDSAAKAFFWPEDRKPYIKRSRKASSFQLPNGIIVPVPKGTPVKLLANMPLHDIAEITRKLGHAVGIPLKPLDKGGLPEAKVAEINKALAAYVTGENTGDKILRALFSLEDAGNLLIKQNLAPDFVENRGHDTIVMAIGSNEDKQALIEFMKHF